MASPLYKKALIIGATSGIGEALAKKLVSQGTNVIVTGRRQDRLNSFVSAIGSSKASAFALDVTDLAALPAFAQKVVAEHPDLDSVIVNAGIQRPFDFTNPETVNFGVFEEELKTNYTSAVAISMAFLPHLKKQKSSSLVYNSATLALVPTMLRTGNYNASKAALHHWILVFRHQLKASGIDNLKVVEIFPPAVQTEIHDSHHQPDLQDGHKIGMPLDQFIEECYQGLVDGADQVAVGHGKIANEGWEMERQKALDVGIENVNKILAPYIRRTA